MPSRTVFVGLDAMDRSLVDAMIGSGQLPVLASLMARGVTAEVATPDVHLVGGTWESFVTGLEPIDHGFWADWQLVPGTYTERRFTPNDVEADPFWHRIDAAGGRVAAVDVPLTSARPLERGISVTEWGSHDRFVGYQTWPASLADDLTRRHGVHAEATSCNRFTEAGRFAELLAGLLEGVRAKTDLMIDLLGREEWDLFLGVYGESHCAGHQYWKFHDPHHPGHATTAALGLGDPLEQVYLALDGQLGRIVDACGPTTDLYVLLSHGMAGHYDATTILPEILAAIADHGGLARSTRRRETAMALGGRLVRKAHRGALKALGVPRPPRRRPVDGSLPAFAVYNNDCHGAIRINVIGREPRGQVERHEVQAVVEELRRDLLDLRNADTGAPVVARVVAASDVYGDRTHPALPDLFIDWVRDEPIAGVCSPKIGTIRGAYAGPRSGDHRTGGRVIACGPGVPSMPGELPDRSEAFGDFFLRRFGASQSVGGESVRAAEVLPGPSRVIVDDDHAE